MFRNTSPCLNDSRYQRASAVPEVCHRDFANHRDDERNESIRASAEISAETLQRC
jgi:hypothetical protein